MRLLSKRLYPAPDTILQNTNSNFDRLMGVPIKNPTLLDEIQPPSPHDLPEKRSEVEHLWLDRNRAAWIQLCQSFFTEFSASLDIRFVPDFIRSGPVQDNGPKTFKNRLRQLVSAASLAATGVSGYSSRPRSSARLSFTPFLLLCRLHAASPINFPLTAPMKTHERRAEGAPSVNVIQFTVLRGADDDLRLLIRFYCFVSRCIPRHFDMMLKAFNWAASDLAFCTRDVRS